jgi:hypothetical protein
MIGTEIKDYPKYSITKEGIVWSYAQNKPKELKPQKTTQNGKYLQVRLYGKDARITKAGKRLGKLKYIHKLVYTTFIGEIPKGMTIDHIDNNPSNNSLENLQLMTQSENSIKGNRKRRRNDLWENREEVIQKYKELGTQKKVADYYNCSDVTIHRVLHNHQKTTRNGKQVIIQL